MTSGRTRSRLGPVLKGALLTLLVAGVVGWLGPAQRMAAPGEGLTAETPSPAGAEGVAGAPSPATSVLTAAEDTTGTATDARVTAFRQAYATLIDSMSVTEGDVVFTMAGRPIHFQDGRMLGDDRLADVDRYDPIFYAYPLTPLVTPPPLTNIPTYSTDHLEVLFGRTETRVRRHCRSVSFLDHNLFVNTLILDPLKRVEREIQEAAGSDPAVAEWIENLDVAYSFIFRDIAKSQTRSLHGFGLAVDLVPISYGGRQVYWQWSRVQNREGWYRIPLSQRWSPPQAVIEAFEHHGFVWGGKWSHFDTIHFEFRPEILLYNRALRATDPLAIR